MIQFNLLPDVKLQYLKAKRSKHLVIIGAAFVSGISVGVLILLFMGVVIFQRQHLNNLTKDIQADSQKLKAVPDLNKVLTVQNQLKNLTALHDQKPVSSRLFSYLNQVTPGNVSISNASIDFGKNSLSIQGNAPDLSTVNKFVDTLKFTQYHTSDSAKSQKPPFNMVVLTSFGVSTDIGGATSGKKASYQVTMNFDPVIFNVTKAVTLDVPKEVTSRSETEKPNLFQLNNVTGGQNQGQ